MIKGKASFPFETIALAVAFSSRLESLVAETARISRVHNAKTVFIHVGKKTSDKQRVLSEYLLRHGFNDLNSTILWENGNPVESILSACKQRVVDLLILGALPKENADNNFGTIAREISRKAKCSLLMLTNPRLHPQPFSSIIVNGHNHSKTINTIHAAVYFARKEGVSDLTIVEEVNMPAMSMSMTGTDDEIIGDFAREENSRLTKFVSRIPSAGVSLHTRMISGREGHTIPKYAIQNKTDLLVVNSPDHLLSIFDRIFTHDLEYVLADIPCNMLIVHSRNSELA